MGAGMAEFCQRPVVTRKDYDLYCHYVAGMILRLVFLEITIG